MTEKRQHGSYYSQTKKKWVPIYDQDELRDFADAGMKVRGPEYSEFDLSNNVEKVIDEAEFDYLRRAHLYRPNRFWSDGINKPIYRYEHPFLETRIVEIVGAGLNHYELAHNDEAVYLFLNQIETARMRYREPK